MTSRPPETIKPDAADLPYRPCVGIMLLNTRGQAWIGRRLPKWVGDRSAHIWQMPQGGIDKRETPIDAAFRELEEETSVTSASLIGEVPGWLTYDLPEDLLGIALKGKYRGQKQRWFAMRFTGKEREIDIRSRRGHKAEFDQWRWEELDKLPGLIVPFKREIYENVVTAFAPLAVPLD